ncbi:MAG: hypothetical protein P4L53_04570 [Candidatus Obscuribacterales bacterium]|nr:hypothetical protein [Candidatus Obscuribacterales bacterium]
MTNKSENTIVVLRAPQRPLVCLRYSDLPLPLEPGQVFDFDSVLYQQTHKAIACIARTEKGAITDVNTLLKGLLTRLYGEDEATRALARGSVNYSAVPCTNEQTTSGGIRIGVTKLLKEGGEDLIFVTCRIVNEDYLREALGVTLKGTLPILTLGLVGPEVEPAGKPARSRRKTRAKTGD